MLRNKKAQTLLEYFILLGFAVAVLVGMRLFMTRSLQEKYRQTGDVFGRGEQYKKGATWVTGLDGPTTNAVIPTNPSLDPCPVVLNSIANLQLAISDLDVRINNLNQSLAEVNSSIASLMANGMTSQSDPLSARANDLKNEIAQCQADKTADLSQIAQQRMDYPQCTVPPTPTP